MLLGSALRGSQQVGAPLVQSAGPELHLTGGRQAGGACAARAPTRHPPARTQAPVVGSDGVAMDPGALLFDAPTPDLGWLLLMYNALAQSQRDSWRRNSAQEREQAMAQARAAAQAAQKAREQAHAQQVAGIVSGTASLIGAAAMGGISGGMASGLGGLKAGQAGATWQKAQAEAEAAAAKHKMQLTRPDLAQQDVDLMIQHLQARCRGVAGCCSRACARCQPAQPRARKALHAPLHTLLQDTIKHVHQVLEAQNAMAKQQQRLPV